MTSRVWPDKKGKVMLLQNSDERRPYLTLNSMERLFKITFSGIFSSLGIVLIVQGLNSRDDEDFKICDPGMGHIS